MIKHTFLRVITLVFAFLFGFVLSVIYLTSQVLEVINRSNMEGYFNLHGMIFVILAFFIVITFIPSLFYHIRLISFLKTGVSNDLLDRDTKAANYPAKPPFLLLRRFNGVFSGALILNGFYTAFDILVVTKVERYAEIFLIICLIMIATGSILMNETIQLNKTNYRKNY